ncbi:hypothetical protein N7533_012597 [Penicillium manginii]|uniref:uncharacterized protein n=1 Tax=Penicillium manginii TaxID=203109 RepID=UPI002549BA93|nr:uncharacterized protein N7533_012597 [Penicillium manginii]KAJ5739813.1 hypothetical protein N7533_012597 [Penicillium manginii]
MASQKKATRDYYETPNPDVPTIPDNANKKKYYNHPELVWYCRKGGITLSPQQKIRHAVSHFEKVKDGQTGDIYDVPVERIRARWVTA